MPRPARSVHVKQQCDICSAKNRHVQLYTFSKDGMVIGKKNLCEDCHATAQRISRETTRTHTPGANGKGSAEGATA